MGILDSFTDNTEDENGISPASRWQAGFQGLTGLGAGLLAYGTDTRQPWPLMAGIQSFQNAMAMPQQYAAQKNRRDLEKLQIEKSKRELEREGKIEADVAALIPTLPPEVQTWAKANPVELSKMMAQAKIEAMNRKPDENEIKRQEILRAVGGNKQLADEIHSGVRKMVVGPDGQPYVVNVGTGDVLSGSVGNKPLTQ